jgi:pimeloyl-ACP methyl ester carboxylesterase
VAAALAVGTRPAVFHAQSAGILLRLEAPSQSASGVGARLGLALRGFDTHPVTESEVVVTTPRGPARARVYQPVVSCGACRRNGLVMVHGVHRLGMDEPRLVRFARSIASTGLIVLTPEVRELADYTVDAASVDTIGAAALALRDQLPDHPRVGVMGLSFAGGLGLLAAGDPRYASSIGYVVSVGAHDDLARVSRFFATGRIEEADGGVLTMKPHDYGPLVVVYAHARDFFPEPDVPIARDALRLWLWEDREKARAKESELSGPAKEKLDLLLSGKLDALANAFLADVDEHRFEMSAVSPHERLGSVHVPVFVVHGAVDNVIPASEALWIAKDLPEDTEKTVLVSKLIGHVEVEGSPPLGERWAAVHFFAKVLAQANAP